MKDVLIRQQDNYSLIKFLEEHDFAVQQLGETILEVDTGENFMIYLNIDESDIYFQVDLGTIDSKSLDNKALYTLLDLNTEITPVSIGIDSSSPEHNLVLVERRELGSLDANELLSVLDALELAYIRVAELLSTFYGG